MMNCVRAIRMKGCNCVAWINLAYEYAFPESRDFIRDLFDKEKTIIASATELAQSRVRVQFIIGYQASELSCALGLE